MSGFRVEMFVPGAHTENDVHKLRQTKAATALLSCVRHVARHVGFSVALNQCHQSPNGAGVAAAFSSAVAISAMN